RAGAIRDEVSPIVRRPPGTTSKNGCRGRYRHRGGSPADLPRASDARMAVAVTDSRADHQTGYVREPAPSLFILAGADLDEQPAAGGQVRRRGGDEAVEDVQTVGAAVQGRARLAVAYVWGQLVNLGRRDVGRVAQDQVELRFAGHRCEQVAGAKVDAVGDA